MEYASFYNKHQLDDDIIRRTGFNPYYIELQSGLDESIVINQEEYIDLASNNYLGIANDKRLKNAAIDAINKYGVSLCATPIAAGYSDLYSEVSDILSNFTGLESSIIYPSCYQANNGLFSAIANKEDIILIDQYAHSSLIEGARAVGCKLRPFLHNNLASLEKNLKHSSRHQQKFVVTESVFSTEGSIAPFGSIIDLCNKYEALPIIDDSHGIGVLGTMGKGILEHEGITNYEGIYTASLGKSIANMGGVVSGKKSIIDYLKYYSSHLVYSTALPPHILAGIKASIKIIESDFKMLSKQLWNHFHTLRDGLMGKGFDLVTAEAPIVSVRTGSAEDTILFAKKLFANKILSTPFVNPSVPKNKGVVRLIAGANFKDSTIERILSIFDKLS